MMIGFEFTLNGGTIKRIVPFSEIRMVDYQVLESGATHVEIALDERDERGFIARDEQADEFLHAYKIFLGIQKSTGPIPPPLTRARINALEELKEVSRDSKLFE